MGLFLFLLLSGRIPVFFFLFKGSELLTESLYFPFQHSRIAIFFRKCPFCSGQGFFRPRPVQPCFLIILAGLFCHCRLLRHRFFFLFQLLCKLPCLFDFFQKNSFFCSRLFCPAGPVGTRPVFGILLPQRFILALLFLRLRRQDLFVLFRLLALLFACFRPFPAAFDIGLFREISWFDCQFGVGYGPAYGADISIVQIFRQDKGLPLKEHGTHGVKIRFVLNGLLQYVFQVAGSCFLFLCRTLPVVLQILYLFFLIGTELPLFSPCPYLFILAFPARQGIPCLADHIQFFLSHFPCLVGCMPCLFTSRCLQGRFMLFFFQCGIRIGFCHEIFQADGFRFICFTLIMTGLHILFLPIEPFQFCISSRRLCLKRFPFFRSLYALLLDIIESTAGFTEQAGFFQ